MGMPADLVFVRHGESEGNVAQSASRKGNNAYFTEEFRKRHSSLWRLTDKGRMQACTAGVWLRKEFSDGFFRYYTSEYLRAMETAALLSFPNATWFLDILLRERDQGDMEAMPEDERRVKFPDFQRLREMDPLLWNPPSGEAVGGSVLLRADRIIATLHRECEGKPVVIVSHGELMWAMRVRLERMTLWDYRRLHESANPFDRIHNCQVLHYTRRNPGTGELAPYLGWVRSVCTTDPSLSSNSWQEIHRPRFTNEELFAVAETTKRLIV
ncbi:MAG: histidine phosphatase family protein [bacterium]|nr:histidine phosphatase family protein [bacterium]